MGIHGEKAHGGHPADGASSDDRRNIDRDMCEDRLVLLALIHRFDRACVAGHLNQYNISGVERLPPVLQRLDDFT